MPNTLFDKIWDAHEVAPGLLYIDLHLVHEVTSPQAFDGLRLAGRQVRRPDRTLATADHNVPDRRHARRRAHPRRARAACRCETLERNCAEFGVPVYSLGSERQGIVHVIGPELGRHPARHDDRLRRLATPPRTARSARSPSASARARSSTCSRRSASCSASRRRCAIRYEGELGFGVTAKDLILGTIGQMGVDGAVGHVVEYAGPAIEALSMEGRMTSAT